MTATSLSDRTLRACMVREMLTRHDRAIVERHLDRLGWVKAARDLAFEDAGVPDVIAQLRDAGMRPKPLMWHSAPAWQALCPACTDRYAGRRLRVIASAPSPRLICAIGCRPSEILRALGAA